MVTLKWDAEIVKDDENSLTCMAITSGIYY